MARQLRWFEKLEPFSFKVEYVPGKDNVMADALSRVPYYEVAAIGIQHPQVMVTEKELQHAAQDDSFYAEVLGDKNLQQQLGLEEHQARLLVRRDGVFWAPANELLRFKLVLEAHEPPFAGYFGVERTEALVRQTW